VLLVGLTGGIGSGKSTVAEMLRKRGAVVVDADELAREAVAKGTPGYERVLGEFGRELLRPDGDLNRERLAEIVFADEKRRRDLESIVHPEVQRRIAGVVREHADSSDVLVLDSPLLIETGSHEFVDVVVLVVADTETQTARLAARGMSVEDASDRIDAQLDLGEKAKVADVLIDNGGSLGELELQVDRLWRDIHRRAVNA
jgi:dephospho-CoA kinase